MAKSYSQLVKQIDVLKRQADEVRKKEVAGVINRVKLAIEFYGLTPQDLFGGKGSNPAGPTTPSKATRAKSDAPRFSDGAGNSWVGRGPRPQWLRTALESGKKLEDFAVSSANGAGAGKSASKKYLSAVKFRDAAGHEWSGRGPKPNWVKEALAGGKKLEDLAV